MTPPNTPDGRPSGDDVEPRVGTDADEQVDTDRVLADAAASADEDALADAGLPREGESAVMPIETMKPAIPARLSVKPIWRPSRTRHA